MALFGRTIPPGGKANRWWKEIALGGYSPPAGGIPIGHLDPEVRGLLARAQTAVTQEVDPTVPDWAKTPSKPTYTAEEVGAISTTQKGVSIATLEDGKVPLGQLPRSFVMERITGTIVPESGASTATQVMFRGNLSKELKVGDWFFFYAYIGSPGGTILIQYSGLINTVPTNTTNPYDIATTEAFAAWYAGTVGWSDPSAKKEYGVSPSIRLTNSGDLTSFHAIFTLGQLGFSMSPGNPSQTINIIKMGY